MLRMLNKGYKLFRNIGARSLKGWFKLKGKIIKKSNQIIIICIATVKEKIFIKLINTRINL